MTVLILFDSRLSAVIITGSHDWTLSLSCAYAPCCHAIYSLSNPSLNAVSVLRPLLCDTRHVKWNKCSLFAVILRDSPDLILRAHPASSTSPARLLCIHHAAPKACWMHDIIPLQWPILCFTGTIVLLTRTISRFYSSTLCRIDFLPDIWFQAI